MTISRAFRAIPLAAALLLGPATARAGHRETGVSIHDGRDPRRCSDLTVEFGGLPAALGEEKLSIAAEAGKPLRVRIAEHSGVRVWGADRADFEVLLCKAAPTRGGLEDISASRDGATLSVRGPAGDDWVGYLLIAAPRAAAMELIGENGPISLSGLSGRVTVRSENGPISVRDSTGDIEAHAENGPIDARGDGGRLRLSTENGPIGVALSGASWKGEGLEARAVNGPVSLAVPAGYRSGTSIESLGHSPFRCRGEACGAARRTWDDDRKRIELGEGPVVVRLSTENGPVSIRTGAEPVGGDED
jgi:hypothetical protein